MANVIPGPKGHFLLGSIPAFKANPPQFLADSAKQYGPVFKFRLANKTLYGITDATYIREVLVKNAQHVEKSDMDTAILSKLLGKGLVSSGGSHHKKQRKLIQPAFSRSQIESYFQPMERHAQNWIAKQTGNNTKKDISIEMREVTLKIVCEALFSSSLDEDLKSIDEAAHILSKSLDREYSSGFPWPKWLPIKHNREIRRARQLIYDIVERFIGEHADSEGSVIDKGDLLSALMLAEGEDKTMMDRQDLKDEILTMFLAGHETVSNTMTWTWYLLSENPVCEAKLHAEIDSVLQGQLPTLDNLTKLTYTMQVIKESMRLIPSVWTLSGRVCKKEIQLDDYVIPAGATMFLPMWVLNKDEKAYPSPETFDPERFSTENEKLLPKDQFMPYGSGPRICVGLNFANLEAQLLLASIAQKFSFKVDKSVPVIPEYLLTVSPKHGVHVEVKKREPASQTKEEASEAILS